MTGGGGGDGLRQDVAAAHGADGVHPDGVGGLFGQTGEGDALGRRYGFGRRRRAVEKQLRDILRGGGSVFTRGGFPEPDGDRAGTGGDGGRGQRGDLKLGGERAVEARTCHGDGGSDEPLRGNSGDGAGRFSAAPAVFVLRALRPVLHGNGQGESAALLGRERDDGGAGQLRQTRHSQILRLQRLIGGGERLIGRLLAADQTLRRGQRRLEGRPAGRRAVLRLRQRFALGGHAAERQEHLEHAVLPGDLVHQLAEAHIPVVGGDYRFVVDPQAVFLHGFQEPVQQRLRQIADQHELGGAVLAVIGRAGGFIALQTRQIADGFIQPGIGHLLHGDGEPFQNGPQPPAAGGICAQVVQDHLIVRDLRLGGEDWDGGGDIVHLLALPLHMGQTQLDKELFTRFELGVLEEREGQTAAGLRALTGVCLGHRAAERVVLPKLAVLDLFIRVRTGAGVYRHVAVKLIAHGEVLVGVVHGQGHGIGVAFHGADGKRGVGRSPVGGGQDGDDVGADLLASGGQHELKTATGLERADPQPDGLVEGAAVETAVIEQLRRFRVQRIAAELIELVVRGADAGVEAQGGRQIRHSGGEPLGEDVGGGRLLFRRGRHLHRRGLGQHRFP